MGHYPTGLYAYGFRYYDPLTARFTGVDPISDQFAFVSVYNYAENSPINGIDLHGLQFVDANDAKIYIHHGGASLKYKNLGAGLKGKIRTASFEIKNSSDGNTSIGMSFPMKVINSMGIVPRSVSTRPTRAPESNGRYAPKPGGNSHQRTVYRTEMNDIGLEPGKVSKVPSPPGKITPAGKGAGAGFLIANGIELGMSIWANSDISTAQAQASYYLAPSEELVRIGIAKNIVPNEYHSNPQVLADLANYVFQGELNGNYDSETKSTLLEIGKNLVFHGHVNGYNVNWRIIPIRKNRE